MKTLLFTILSMILLTPKPTSQVADTKGDTQVQCIIDPADIKIHTDPAFGSLLPVWQEFLDSGNMRFALGDAKTAAKAELDEAKENATSDEAKEALDEAKDAVDGAMDVSGIDSAVQYGIEDADEIEAVLDIVSVLIIAPYRYEIHIHLEGMRQGIHPRISILEIDAIIKKELRLILVGI